jgi:hypothetical protein
MTTVFSIDTIYSPAKLTMLYTFVAATRSWEMFN